MNIETPVPLKRTFRPDAFLTLVAMTIERLLRGRRVLVLALVFLLPTGIALLARQYADPFEPDQIEAILIFTMIPQALLPLTALVFAASMIQDEVEDQTLTYLLIRPIPRWAVYTAKWLATTLVAGLVTVVFTGVTLAVIHGGSDDFPSAIVLGRYPRIAALFALATLVYSSIFGFLSLIFRRTLVIGVAYVILFEGIFANIDFVVRKATVMYHLRVLAERWLDLHVASWAVDLDEAPSGWNALLTLLAAALLTTIAAGFVMSVREFRLKTPEGA